MGLWKPRRGLVGSHAALYGPGLVQIGNPTLTTTNKNAGITLSSGDTEADWVSGSGSRNVFATKEFIGGTSVKHVFAVRLDTVAAATTIRIGPVPTSTSGTAPFGGSGQQPIVYDPITGETRRNSALVTSNATAGNGDIVMIGFHSPATTGGCHVIFGKNGTWFVDPATIETTSGPNPGLTINVDYHNGYQANATGVGMTLVPWPYAVPSGFTAPGDV